MSQPFGAGSTPSEPQAMRVYVGTYTGGASEGIYLLRFDPGSGALDRLELAGRVENPSFLALHPDPTLLYCVNETSDFGGRRTGGVSAFRVSPETGLLTLLNQQPSEGTSPCHLVVDRAGRNVLVANYGSGTVAVLPLAPDGSLRPASCVVQHEGSSVDPKRQEGPHAHSVNLDPGGRFALVADLGLDQVRVYRFDPDAGSLTPHEPPYAACEPGCGPRHLTFHPNGRWVYVINEMGSSVTAYDYDAGAGALRPRHSARTLPEGWEGASTTAEVQVTPDGRFLYGSNRGHDSLAIYSIDPEDGRLTPLGHQPTLGREPRNFCIDPTGRFLLAANQKSDTLVVFRIDAETGALTPTGHTAQVPAPVCVKVPLR